MELVLVIIDNSVDMYGMKKWKNEFLTCRRPVRGLMWYKFGDSFNQNEWQNTLKHTLNLIFLHLQLHGNESRTSKAFSMGT